MSKKFRIIFAGTPYFAARHLHELLSFGHQIVGVFTKPDRPAGRNKKIMQSPVKVLAKKIGLPIFQPISLYSQENEKLISNLKADIMVVVAYGLIIPKSILTIPLLGCINVHGSLLPRWRGAAPIQRALLAGDRETGITVMQMEEALDTGNILYKLKCPITTEDTSATLYDKLANLGSKGLINALQRIEKGTLIPTVQDESLVTHAKKLSKKEAQVDWSLSVFQLERCIRAFNPWPVSWFIVNEQPIKIWKASVICNKLNSESGILFKIDKNSIQVEMKDGILNLELLQPPGKKVMSTKDFLNSRKEWFTYGIRFS